MKNEIGLEELREIQLDILSAIHQFCEKEGLRYSLGGGTLLGAIRHKGYIPWDDDIDIMLPRPDYDRFVTEFDGKYSYYKVQHCGNDETYPKVFGKVFDQRTLLVEFNTRAGISVDVFPVDGLPSEDEMTIYMEEYKALRDAVIRTSQFYKMVKPQYRLYRYVRYVFNKLRMPKHSEAISDLHDFLIRYPFETSSCAGAITGAYAEKEWMDSSVFKSYIDVCFEKRTYKSIAQYDAYLAKHYGDYLKLPPLDKQKSHHTFKAYWK